MEILNTPLRIGLASFFSVLVLGFLFNLAGFRIGENLTIVRTGSLAITNVDTGTRVFLDNRRKLVNLIDGVFTIKNITAGAHTLIITKDTTWPWVKEIEIYADDVTVVQPFLIAQNPLGTVVKKDTEPYQEALLNLQGAALPTEEKKATSSDGTVSLWSDGHAIFAEWLPLDQDPPQFFCDDSLTSCPRLKTVFNGVIAIRQLDFYGARNDTIIFSIESSVFALEIDTRGTTQNFQPIYKGRAPTLVRVDNTSILVGDSDSIFQIEL